MRRGVPTWGAAAALRRIVKASAPDVVQGWMYHANLAATMGSALSGLRPQVLWNVRHALHADATETPMTRSEARRVGTECVSTSRSRCSQSHTTKYNQRLARLTSIIIT